MEASIESLRDTQRRYAHVLRLARAMASHFANMVHTQVGDMRTLKGLGKLVNRGTTVIRNCVTDGNLIEVFSSEAHLALKGNLELEVIIPWNQTHKKRDIAFY